MPHFNVTRRTFLATGTGLTCARAFAGTRTAADSSRDVRRIRAVRISNRARCPPWPIGEKKADYSAWCKEPCHPSQNTNNASICCGVWPDKHGITGNSYFDERTGREEYMETADLLMAPTLFQRAQKKGVKSALLSSKKKNHNAAVSRSGSDSRRPKHQTADWVKRLGAAP